VAVLLQYNHKTSFTIQQLQENTQISRADLEQVLMTLLKIRLLFCDYSAATTADEDGDGGTLPPDAVCHLYQDYNNKKTHVNINVPLRSTERRELEATQKNIDEERRYLTEAAVIRVMKTKKELGHHELVGAVMGQLAARFRPDRRAVKKCIDDLIDRDYLKRCQHSASIYQYVA